MPHVRGPCPHGQDQTFDDVLWTTAADRPDDMAFQFLADGEHESARWSFGELERRSRDVARAVASVAGPGERVILLYPPGLEFVPAFFGCLAAGVIAVPTFPPRPERAWQGQHLIAAIAKNCSPKAILTGGESAAAIRKLVDGLPELEGVAWLNTNDVARTSGERTVFAARSPQDLAMLQYTSGATGDPKGVMVRHSNLLHNEEMMRRAFGHTEETEYAAGVCWLPPYHDMGLMGHVLHGVYIGFPCAIIPPLGILQRPRRWLEALTHYRADASGGPNFVYDLCAQRIAPEDRAGLDLSAWNVAGIGAEPIRAQTIEDFAIAFEPQGFRREAFYPSYGLAEATLFVAGGDPGAAPVIRDYPRELGEGAGFQSQGGETQRLVGCGRAWMDQTIEIIDPETRRPAADRVGEIWVSGPSVCAGYWNRPDETRETFGAAVEGGEARTFLRTGDLGFVDDGELFVVGRLKDLIIIRGKNFHPQDIEVAVQSVHPALKRDGGAAFGIDVAGEEQLVVVQEIDRQSRVIDLEWLTWEIRKAVSRRFELRLHDMVFLKNGSLPKTTSGKVQRRESRRKYLRQDLTVWQGKSS